MKLFLYSFAFTFSDKQAEALSQLVGKPASDITMVLIDNAAEIIPDSAGWIGDTHAIMQSKGYQTEVVDLNDWQDDQEGLRKELSGKDVIWVNAGNTFHLRWVMKKTGADKIITECVKNGAVYAGWSAGAIVAGPTLRGIENMEETAGVPEIVTNGLGLTQMVIIPHVDNPEFAEAAEITTRVIKDAGYLVQPLTDSQALVINDDQQSIV